MAETTYSNLIVQALEDQQAAVDALAAARTAIAEAITAKGVSTPSTTKFNAMAAKINSIKLGATIATGTFYTEEYQPEAFTVPCSFSPTIFIMFTTASTNTGYDTNGYYLYMYYNGKVTLYNSLYNNSNVYAKTINVESLVSSGGVINIQAPSIEGSLGNIYDYFYGNYAKNNGYTGKVTWKWYAIK